MASSKNSTPDMSVTKVVLRFSVKKVTSPPGCKLPPFSFRLLEIIVRGYKRWFCRDIVFEEDRGIIDVHLAGFVAVDKIYDNIGPASREYINIQTRIPGMSVDEETALEGYQAFFSSHPNLKKRKRNGEDE